ncbi:MAG: hypothetical protein H6738_17035 [Alphaproteobacteria bacterium]|nr:hypothetical protein [Alphaproteobacteria bacterium]MCB9698489.1 hypothetical protein [Alphaproteobacteria bacterium]
MWWWIGVALADCEEVRGPAFPDDFGVEPVPTDAILPVRWTMTPPQVVIEGPDGPIGGHLGVGGFVPEQVLEPDTEYLLRATWDEWSDPEEQAFRTGDGPSDATHAPRIDDVHFGGHSSVSYLVCGTSEAKWSGPRLVIEGELRDWEPLARLELLLRDGDLQSSLTPMAASDTFTLVEEPHGRFVAEMVALVDEICVVPVLVDAAGGEHPGDAVCDRHHGCDTGGGGAPLSVSALVAAWLLRRSRASRPPPSV